MIKIYNCQIIFSYIESLLELTEHSIIIWYTMLYLSGQVVPKIQGSTNRALDVSYFVVCVFNQNIWYELTALDYNTIIPQFFTGEA